MNYNYDDNTSTNEEATTDQNIINNEPIVQQKRSTNKIYNILTAIIYPAILAIIFTIVFTAEYRFEDVTPIIQYLIGLVLYAFSVFTILQTDLYLLVIPLPILTFYRVGCCETKKTLWLRIICGILSIILMIAPFFILLMS